MKVPAALLARQTNRNAWCSAQRRLAITKLAVVLVITALGFAWLGLEWHRADSARAHHIPSPDQHVPPTGNP